MKTWEDAEIAIRNALEKEYQELDRVYNEIMEQEISNDRIWAEENISSQKSEISNIIEKLEEIGLKVKWWK